MPGEGIICVQVVPIAILPCIPSCRRLVYLGWPLCTVSGRGLGEIRAVDLIPLTIQSHTEP